MKKQRLAPNFGNCKTLHNLWKLGKKTIAPKKLICKEQNCGTLKTQEQKMCTRIMHIKNLNLVGNVQTLENTHTHTHKLEITRNLMKLALKKLELELHMKYQTFCEP